MTVAVWRLATVTCLTTCVAVAVGVGGASAAPGAVSTVCVSEPYQWFGETPLAPGESLATGVVVSEQAGTQLQVTAVDTATGGSGALVVLVGADTARAGASVTGGEMSATNGGAEALVVTSIAMNIDRCHQVASAPPQAAVRVTAPSAQPVVGPQPDAAGSPAALPKTGATSASLVVVAFGCTTGGLLLRRLSRRRSAA